MTLLRTMDLILPPFRKEHGRMGHPRLRSGPGRHSQILRGEGFVGGLVGLAGEEGGDGDVFVEGLPVESAGADAELFALLGCGAEEAGGSVRR